MNASKYKVVMLVIIPAFLLVGLSLMAKQKNSPKQGSPLLKYHDYSTYGKNYHILKGLPMKANSVKFEGMEKSKVLGTELQFSKFNIVSPVTVQISSTYTSGMYDTAVGLYSLSIASDPADIARREFLRQIKSYWKVKTTEELRDYKVMPAQKYIWVEANRYVLYAEPDNEWLGATYLLYSSGKVIRLTFNGYKSGNGWGGLSSFIHDNLLFKFSDAQIRCGYTPSIAPKEFLEHYNSGRFNKPPTR